MGRTSNAKIEQVGLTISVALYKNCQ